jgi:hypothetical protein
VRLSKAHVYLNLMIDGTSSKLFSGETIRES